MCAGCLRAVFFCEGRTKSLRSYLILGMCALFLVNYFLSIRWMESVVVAFVFAAFFGSVTKADAVPRWFGISMLGIGLYLEIDKGGGAVGIQEGILMNLPLLTLVILVPLLAVPLKLGGNFDAIEGFLQRFKHQPRKLFLGITSVLFLLGPILNLGSIRIVDELIKGLKLPPPMLAKSYAVGFSTTMFWSPYYASVALVLYYMKIPAVEYMAYGIGLGLLFLLIGNLLFAAGAGRHPSEPGGAGQNASAELALSTEHRRKLYQLGFIITCLMSVTLLLEAFTEWSMLAIVSLLAIAFPLVWGIATNGFARMKPHLIDFRDCSVPLMNNEIVLFTSAGFLGHAMQGTSFGNGIRWFLISLSDQSFMLFAVVVVAVVAVVTFIGVHPMVVVTALLSQMNAQELGTTNHVLAILLILAWSVSAVISPVNPMNLLISRLSGLSGLQTGLRYNGLHVLCVAVLGLFLITMFHYSMQG